MAQDTLLGFPAHTFPYRRGEFTTLSTVSNRTSVWTCGFFSPPLFKAASPWYTAVKTSLKGVSYARGGTQRNDFEAAAAVCSTGQRLDAGRPAICQPPDHRRRPVSYTHLRLPTKRIV